MVKDPGQPQSLRSSIRHCQHIYTKGIFQTGLLVEHIGQLLGICTLFQFQHNTDTFLGRLVGNIHNICSCLRFHQSTDIIEEFSNISADHGIWNLCNDQLLLAPL